MWERGNVGSFRDTDALVRIWLAGDSCRVAALVAADSLSWVKTDILGIMDHYCYSDLRWFG